jgi:uncharacterized protein YbjT (DUF2867 family)
VHRSDWGDAETYPQALAGVQRVYLIGPVMRTDFVPEVSKFLDVAESAGVEHVTYLSAYGTESSPQNSGVRGVELDLIARERLSHSILRPAWFMQNFSETFLRPVDRVIAVPTGEGSEAFIDVDDLAAVAAVTLSDPAAHAGAEYSLTGPAALTVADAATVISGVTGELVTHVDVDRETWVAALLAAGVPAEYGAVLRGLTATIASGNGARPNDLVEKVTGRRPGTFADFARRSAAAWKTFEPR